ncbi:TolC family protein [Leptospira sp. 96542]|nr:TolC family protein [Leptospira sp. 96542]
MKRLFVLLSLVSPMVVFSQTLEFSEVWEKIESNSSGSKAKFLEWKASEINKNKSEKHWLPRVYTDIRSFQTNDPTLNFMGKLGQRKATEADFSTSSVRLRPGNFLNSNNEPYSNLNSDSTNLFAKDTLNYPGSNVYTRGTLGVDLAIYEGGSGKTKSRMAEQKTNGLKFEWLAIKDREYAQAGFYYRAIQSLIEYQTRIEQIQKIEYKFQTNYQLTNKANPVGYSGYLALKTLRNQLIGIHNQIDEQIFEYKEILQILSGIPSTEIITNHSNLLEFLDLYFDRLAEYKGSNHLNALSLYAESEKLKSDLELSKFLPKVAAYSETYVYQGSRGTSDAYQAGIYLQMNLYDPKDIGSVEEAKLSSESFFKTLEEKKKEEEKHVKQLRKKEISYRENFELIRNSIANLEEQVLIMQRLFQSGAINAIQFADTLNKYSDISKALFETEIGILQVRTEYSIFLKSGRDK